MKTVTKLSLIVASIAALGTSAAFADDQQLQNRLAMQQRDAQRDQAAITVAVYSDGTGVGRREEARESGDVKLVRISNHHGHQNFIYRRD